MPIRTDGPAPYAPPATVLTLLKSFRDRGLTTPFTPDVLTRAGVSESLVPRTLLSLKGLDLVDEQGNPTPALEGLRKAPEADYKKRLEEIVRAVYAEAFQFTDPAKDDTNKISDAFRSYTPLGQRARMVTLFVGLCEAAGIIPEGKKPPISAGRPTPRHTGRNAAPRQPASVSHNANVRNVDGGFIPKPLLGLLAGMPTQEEGWGKAQRDRFLRTFEAVLDFCIPLKTEAELKAAMEEE
jgi:uncharacterized protein DUF5343